MSGTASPATPTPTVTCFWIRAQTSCFAREQNPLQKLQLALTFGQEDDISVISVIRTLMPEPVLSGVECDQRVRAFGLPRHRNLSSPAGTMQANLKPEANGKRLPGAFTASQDRARRDKMPHNVYANVLSNKWSPFRLCRAAEFDSGGPSSAVPFWHGGVRGPHRLRLAICRK